jgi:erythromycin esterase
VLYRWDMRLAFLSLALLSVPLAAQSVELNRATEFDTLLAPGQAHRYRIELRTGESANVTFRQMGVDIVVELRDPSDSLFASFDSPNGRQGDESVEIIAERSGSYELRVRPYDGSEPEGRYHVKVDAIRNIAGTNELLAARGRARDSAAVWLRGRGGRLSPEPERLSSRAVALFDGVAQSARVLGIGEATHGSREFNDMRLALTKRAVEHSGFRIVAIEASAMRLEQLDAYVSNRAPASALQLTESGWIGRRTLRALVIWLRGWNLAHPADRVRLVGVDAGDFLPALPRVRATLRSVYGERAVTQWDPLERELAAADSQGAVFGDSRVAPGVRDTLFQLANILTLDAPVLRRVHGDSIPRFLISAFRSFTQFADYNSGSTSLSHHRDWYMAANVLRALDEAGPRSKALYWAHNAHVAHRDRTPASGTTGGVLHAALGCGYQAIAQTFSEGSFTAQRPNDVEDRLEASTLPANPPESIEGVARQALNGDAFFAWGCRDSSAVAPAWLRRAQAMHWVGGLWTPGSLHSGARRPFNLLTDFDALVHFSRVRAEDIPTDRPRIPPRRP